MKKKIIVTGASGFIGSYFVKNTENFLISEIDLFKITPEDINFSGIDAVLHLAAIAHQDIKDERIYYKINKDLAFEVALKAKKSGVKQFIFMSSSKVYGEFNEKNKSWDENSGCFPVDAYGKSKLEAEKIIRDIEDKNFKVAIIRSPLVYGEGVKANMLKLIKLVDKYRMLPLGGIRNKRSMVYIGNLCGLFSKVIEKKSFGIFIAGDSPVLSTSQLIKVISKQLKKNPILFKMPQFLQYLIKFINQGVYIRVFGSLELDSTNTNKHLNHKPLFTTEEGIARMINWYKTNK